MTTRWPASVAVAGTVCIGAAAAALSFASLCDLAARSGVAVPALWPAIVDGVVIVATVAVVAGAGRYAWGLLIVGALVSVAGNVVHAALPEGVLPAWLRATVAAIPPIALVAVTHLAVRLRRTPSTPNVLRDRVTQASDSTCDVEALSQPGEAGRQLGSEGRTSSELVTQLVEVPVLAYDDATSTAACDTVATSGNGDAVRTRAFELLATGTSPRAVAAQLGVHRATVYRWKRSHAPV